MAMKKPLMFADATLEDVFAACALVGILADHGRNYDLKDSSVEDVAQWAYEQAAEMVEQARAAREVDDV